MAKYAVFNNSFFQAKPVWMPAKLHTVVCLRSNPRTQAYMLNLLKTRHPDFILTEVNKIPTDSEILLLYPDSIGMGWKAIENVCSSKSKNLKVLNGRGREFNLDDSTRLKLLWKRFLEKTFIPEIFFAPILILTGLILGITDKLTGRS